MGLICSILNGSINVILDIILIMIMKVGVLGACLSTMFGDIAVFIVGVVFFCNKNNEIHFVSPKGDFLGTTLESCKAGLPQFINTASASLTSLISNYQLLRYIGNDGIAANSIVTDLRRILTSAFFGFTTTIGPVVSYAYGNRNRPRLRKLMRQKLILWSGGAVIFMGIGLLLRHQMISIFLNANDNAQTFYEMTYYGLTLEFLGILFFSGCIIFTRLLIAVRQQKLTTSFSLIRNLLIRCSCLVVLQLLLGSRGIWAASPVCELISFMIAAVLFRTHLKDFGFKPK